MLKEPVGWEHEGGEAGNRQSVGMQGDRKRPIGEASIF
jgi:hypothetical protein